MIQGDSLLKADGNRRLHVAPRLSRLAARPMRARVFMLGKETSLYEPRRFFWCLRFADVLEPRRRWDWEGLDEFRSTVYAGLMEKAALLHSEWLIGWLPEIGIPVHPNMIKCFQELSKS